MSLVILDYGIGNLRSVQKAFEKVGTPALITSDPQRVAEAMHVVLPGVGAFCDCMDKFTAAQLKEPVLDHLRRDKPFLGICVGMQMLLTTGHENGTHAGLGIFEGEVVRFPTQPGYKVPHMGWNQAKVTNEAPFWKSLTDPAWYYFVHSYYCVPKDRSLIALETDYLEPFCSALQRGRLLATQFHPEKSQQAGLNLLAQFVQL
jgi:glutamine amidotransferase